MRLSRHASTPGKRLTEATGRGLSRARVGGEDGLALVLALCVLVVFTITGTTAIYYASTNSRSAVYSTNAGTAYTLAESGINNAMSVLNLPSNNALNPGLLPTRRTDYANGYVVWAGTLDSRAAVWTVTSTSYVRNPNARSKPISRKFTASVVVTPTLSQPLNNPSWNYIYATRPVTPGVCDEVVQQSVQVASPFYVNGNLCLQNTATITSGPLVVRGSLTLTQSANAVGSASAPINEAHIAGGCQYKNNPVHNPCQGAADNVFAQRLDSSPTSLAAPVVYWDSWYRNASPGPFYPCQTVSGTPPTFDILSPTTPPAYVRDNNVATPFNLTPSASYTCTTANGQLSWNATTRTLTVSGTIFIDGSAYIQNGAVNSYNGQATLYLSGTFLMKNSKLCAGLSANGSTCDFSNWNPNTEMLCIVANGSGGQVNSWDGIQLVSSTFQGALYATRSIDSDTTANVDGPIIADQVNLGQSVTTSFPTITVVPVGMPSNPTVYAQPNPPTMSPG
jgi:hypothetical protein